MFNKYAVIFDMDGVLSDTGPVHFESWVKMTSEIGVEFTKEFFEKIFGQQSPEIIRKLMGPNVDEITIEKWANLKEKYYRDMVKDQLKPLPELSN
ncbi:MAG TPA: HAD hydrolase-like protein [Candidatus Lokiarchaeia archaeon]